MPGLTHKYEHVNQLGNCRTRPPASWPWLIGKVLKKSDQHRQQIPSIIKRRLRESQTLKNDNQLAMA
jgi:hypothetical protein